MREEQDMISLMSKKVKNGKRSTSGNLPYQLQTLFNFRIYQNDLAFQGQEPSHCLVINEKEYAHNQIQILLLENIISMYARSD